MAEKNIPTIYAQGPKAELRKIIKAAAKQGGTFNVVCEMHAPFAYQAEQLAQMANGGASFADFSSWEARISSLQASSARYDHRCVANYGGQAMELRERGPRGRFVPDAEWGRRMTAWAERVAERERFAHGLQQGQRLAA